MKWWAKGGNGVSEPSRGWFRMPEALPIFFALSVIVLSVAGSGVLARDASFLDPGSAAGAGAGDDAIKVEPKGDIDIGDSSLNVARRTDLFFVNQSAVPVKVEKVTVNGDGNVATEVVSDDCSKQGSIPSGSRCSVEVSLTPSSPGPWTAEVLMTHDGAGRIAKAKLTGKTSGTASTEKKDMGLALNTKESNPVNFGTVDTADGKIVRSALMVNDSADPITLYAIDVIEASNGLQKLEQGCAIDMELKPGESCPVTLVWTPSTPGQISTDLIIRHSGRLGFAVIPIRGIAKGETKDNGDARNTSSSSSALAAGSQTGIPAPPGAREVERAVNGQIPAVSADVLGASGRAASGKTGGMDKSIPALSLIGTVGNRAIILKPDGKTTIVDTGDDIDLGEQQVKVVLVTAKSVEISADGKTRTLHLGSSAQLVEKAVLHLKGSKGGGAKEKDTETDAPAGSSAGSSSSTTSASAANSSSGATAGGTSVSGAAK